ncbi:hypothetical protein QBC32DRAFT_335668 [Pseudoneurospora amorphoporcata]|uniref:Uncharacterized protein n=1 Tax=Pseudoneurospora amorphoporcata TaxID=241081 RepID=A0AAN6SIN4_9PEZI|nr:hypothetical protein QBC32DRAFT_335668 [Pseudoneurospora amorphoporcata]
MTSWLFVHVGHLEVMNLLVTLCQPQGYFIESLFPVETPVTMLSIGFHVSIVLLLLGSYRAELREHWQTPRGKRRGEGTGRDGQME